MESVRSAIFVSPQVTATGENFLVAYRNDRGFILRYAGIGEFEIVEGSDHITYTAGALENVTETMEDIYRSSVLTFQSELRGVRGLHASAVVIGGRAVGFMANSGQGKSSLATALLVRGYPLLTDDILPVEEGFGGFTAQPGYPRLRLWPEQARAFNLTNHVFTTEEFQSSDKLQLPVGDVGFGKFYGESVPLACLYILERRDFDDPCSEISITPLSQRDAVIELVRFSFLPRLTAAAGLQAERLEFFARLSGRIPIRKLTYPSGVDKLMEVVERLIKNCEARIGSSDL